MDKGLRVVHYLNQFFGGIGGEEKADTEPQTRDGAVGPGRAINQVLGGRGEVIGGSAFRQRSSLGNFDSCGS